MGTVKNKELEQNIGKVHTDYDEITAYLNSVPKFTSKNTPEVTKRYLELLGAPDRTMKIIHVAGTNGKGSVCCYLASILMEAGYTAGAFISPHLVTVRERMMLNSRMIRQDEFIQAFLRVRTVYLQSGAGEGLPHPSYFEFLFLMFMSWIQSLERRPDYVILETGLGGRLDSTNTVAQKKITVITRIGMDHMEYLGNTIPEIASEKAGIIRKQVPVICLKDPPEAWRVISSGAAAAGSECVSIEPESFADVRRISSEDVSGSSIAVSLHLPSGTELRTELQTPALYQAENAALAAAAIDCLRQQSGTEISDIQIEDGLQHAFWPGRMEECLPGVFLDGAHNADGIHAFLESVREMKNIGGRNLLLFSAVRDKQFHVMTDEVASSGLFDRIAAAPMRTGRSLTERVLEESLVESFREQSMQAPPMEKYASVRDAFRSLMKIKNQNDRIYAAGSLYLVGEVKEILLENETGKTPA